LKRETFVNLLETYISYILQTQGRCYIIFSEILNQRNLLQFGLTVLRVHSRTWNSFETWSNWIQQL